MSLKAHSVLNDEEIIVKTDNPRDSYSISKRLDCGIAMLHLELGAFREGVKGEWQFYFDAEKVAKF